MALAASSARCRLLAQNAVSRCPLYRRSWGISGSAADDGVPTRMTHKRHRAEHILRPARKRASSCRKGGERAQRPMDPLQPVLRPKVEESQLVDRDRPERL
jgi:hypothetical protein